MYFRIFCLYSICMLYIWGGLNNLLEFHFQQLGLITTCLTGQVKTEVNVKSCLVIKLTFHALLWIIQGSALLPPPPTKWPLTCCTVLLVNKNESQSLHFILCLFQSIHPLNLLPLPKFLYISFLVWLLCVCVCVYVCVCVCVCGRGGGRVGGGWRRWGWSIVRWVLVHNIDL